MKTVWVLLFGTLILGCSPSYAQKVAHRPLPGDGGDTPPPVPPGALFVGTWEWADAGEVFHLTITRNPSYVFSEFPNLPPRNVIICQFVYTRNGIVVDQSLTTGRLPYAALGSPANNRSVEMVFYESGTKGYGSLTLTFDPNNSDVLNWTLRPREAVYRNPADRPAVPFLMPRTMTLTRQ